MTHYLRMGATVPTSFPNVTTETAGCRDVGTFCGKVLGCFYCLPGMAGGFLRGSSKPCQGACPHSGDLQVGLDRVCARARLPTIRGRQVL